MKNIPIILTTVVISIIALSCNRANSTKKQEATNNSFCKFNVFGEYTYENKDYSITLTYVKDDIDGFSIQLKTKNNPRELFFSAISHSERINESKSELFPLSLDNIQPNTFYRYSEIEFIDIELNEGYDLNFNGHVKDFSIQFLEKNQIEFQCKGLEKIVKEFYGFDIEESIILTNKNPFGCFDYDINISYNNFDDQKQKFIFHDLDGEGLKVATKEMIQEYIFSDYSGWNTSITKLFEKFGNVYLIDFNNDGAKDIAGFFINEFKMNSPLYFKIYLNNGISYNEVYSENLSADILNPVYFPSQMNNQNVLEIKYVHKDLTNILYWDKLENKIKDHLTD